MTSLLEGKAEDVARICAKRRVRRLALFGSGTGDRFNPATSDLDFLVEFYPMPPVEHGDAYFGLQEYLQAALGAPVDLVERAAIRNPYFLQTVEPSKIVLYDAG